LKTEEGIVRFKIELQGKKKKEKTVIEGQYGKDYYPHVFANL
jgi:hypothetical protein